MTANWDQVVKGHRAELALIHPNVLSATADELIDAGWKEFDRVDIPGHWRDVINVQGWWKLEKRRRNSEGKRLARDRAAGIATAGVSKPTTEPRPQRIRPPRPNRYKPNPKAALMEKIKTRLAAGSRVSGVK